MSISTRAAETSSFSPTTGRRRTDAELASVAAERQTKYGFRYDLPETPQAEVRAGLRRIVDPLTDDFAPVEYLKAVERHNEKRAE